ncbi:MAG TPA: aromatic ring-hydroxylating dioxygenase subunit alpha [Acidimicrobiales bacterium]
MLRRCWHPVARAADLGAPDGGPVAVRLLGEDWALVRLDGRSALLPDRCPHRGMPLSAGRVVDASLECPYHGYRFDADGTCVRIPAQDPSVPIGRQASCEAAACVVERYGLVWAAVEEPVTALPEIPEHGDPGFEVLEHEPQVWAAGAAQMADNFLDLTHVPFVHPGSFGDPDGVRLGEAAVTRADWGFEAVVRNRTKKLDDILDQDGGYTLLDRVNRFRFTPPFHVYLRLEFSDGTVLVLTFFAQPIDAERSRLFSVTLRNEVAQRTVSTQESLALAEVILDEDRRILEQLPGTAVPLELTAEHHTKADRVTVEMRRVLADLVTRTTAGA